MLVNVGPRPQPSVENLGEWPRPRVGTAGPLSYKVDLATPTHRRVPARISEKQRETTRCSIDHDHETGMDVTGRGPTEYSSKQKKKRLDLRATGIYQ